MQLAKAEQTISVGEKVSPSPWLSFGASVLISDPESKCIAVVLKSPRYLISNVLIIYL
jgi:hypothetical protein